MKFRKSNYQGAQNVFYLVTDNWDDFDFKTTFKLVYCDKNRNKIEIGIVKIGKKGMEESNGRTEIPIEFPSLPIDFFSVGNDEEYYEKLNRLGSDIRKNVLVSLNDIAFNKEIFNLNFNEKVLQTSLLRSVSTYTVLNQFHRMSQGGARLTDYRFIYKYPVINNVNNQSPEIEFTVDPKASLPTNIHVIIGKNGVGKSYLLKNIVEATKKSESEKVGSIDILREKNHFELWSNYLESQDPFERNSLDNLTEIGNYVFANVIYVSFSAFDMHPVQSNSMDDKIQHYYITVESSQSNNWLEDQLIKFIDSLKLIFASDLKLRMWTKSIKILNYDNYFKDLLLSPSEIEELRIDIFESTDSQKTKEMFTNLSSGYKIILLSISRIISVVVEKSLVILDEPELHLHPPLLSAYIRILSNILIQSNGVAIIATHSPIVLQEVPASCVWIIHRNGDLVTANRTDIETFGTNISTLTREVFGVEIEKTGYITILESLLDENGYDVDTVLSQIDNKIGDEGLAMLYLLSRIKEGNL